MSDLSVSIPESSTPRRGIGRGGIIVIGIILIVAAIFGLALSRLRQPQPQSGPAPDFSLGTFYNGTLKLSELRGKVVVVNFWASWCGPCRDEAAELEATYKQYKDKGVVFIGVAWTDTDTNARAYLNEYKITYPNGMDMQTRISAMYRIQGVPETFIVDKNGNIDQFVMVPLTQKQLTSMIERTLAKQ